MPQLLVDVFFDQALQSLIIFICSSLFLACLFFPGILIIIVLLKKIMFALIKSVSFINQIYEYNENI